MSSKIFADLHNHTRASDGDFSPQGLVAAARKMGLSVLGIADHDTLKGLPAALSAGDKAGVTVVPGVEVSVRFQRPYFTGTLHLLCYFLRHRLADPAFVSGFEAILARGRGEGLVKARIERINAVFGPKGESPLLPRDLMFEDIFALSPNASRRHFALALDKALGISDKTTINDIIGNDSPAYLPSGVELEAVAPFIREQNLLAVLAHPAAGSFPGEGHYKEVLPPFEIVERILPEFISAGIRGIEVYYPGHTPAHQKALLDLAEQHGFVVTGGSDCHDETHRPLGMAGISQDEFIRFHAALE